VTVSVLLTPVVTARGGDVAYVLAEVGEVIEQQIRTGAFGAFDAREKLTAYAWQDWPRGGALKSLGIWNRIRNRFGPLSECY
jgi:hypothetical protein